VEIAQALQAGLDRIADCTLWTQGVFTLGRGFLESLFDLLPDQEYAILVLTPDDLINKRDVSGFAPRDNVLFELGLFMGALGRRKTFMVSCADDQLELPSDLLGIQQARFRRRADGNLLAALGPVVLDIQRAMKTRR
jgi:predicted nucleotide-binding protein